MSVTSADLDEDGDQDLYVLNDATPSFVFLNDGRGRFVESGVRCGLALGRGGRPVAAMAIGIGDLNETLSVRASRSRPRAGGRSRSVAAPRLSSARTTRGSTSGLARVLIAWIA